MGDIFSRGCEMPTKQTVLAILLGIIPFGAAAEQDEFCGEITHVESYETVAGGLSLSFPRHLEIHVDGELIFADEGSSEWVYPRNGLSIAETREHVLIEAYAQDCIDLLFRRLFVVSSSGDLILSQPIWTSHWNDAFFYEGSNLVYWSAWFCHRENKEVSSENSYVYLWPGRGEFQKQIRPYEALCSSENAQRILRNRNRFRDLSPKRPKDGTEN